MKLKKKVKHLEKRLSAVEALVREEKPPAENV